MKLSIAWRLFVSGLAFLSVFGSVVSVLAAWIPEEPTLAGWMAAVIAALSGAFAGRGTIAGPADRTAQIGTPAKWLELAVMVCFGVACVRLFLFCVYLEGGEVCTLLPQNRTDIAVHLGYINYLAAGPRFWPESPSIAGAGFGYPFGVDLLNAALLRMGVDLFVGIALVGIWASISTAFALFAWGRGAAVGAFLFNGGFFGIWLLCVGADENPDAIADWKNIAINMFACHRGLQYAFPAGLLLLYIWRQRHAPLAVGENHSRISIPFCAEVLLYATLPLFHLHTFLFLSFVLGCFGLFGRGRLHAWRLAALAFVPATVQVWHLTNGFAVKNALAWQFGWLRQESEGVLYYWIGNFGLFLPLIFLACVAMLRRLVQGKNVALEVDWLLVTIPPFLLLLATFCIRFAPWAWDNTKLMAWCYLMLIPPLFRFLSNFSRALRACIVVLLFFSGFVAVVKTLAAPDKGWRVISVAELTGVRSLFSTVGGLDRVACAPVCQHPALILGHPVAMTDTFTLTTHAIDFTKQKEDLERLMNGAPGWQLSAKGLGVRLLFWGRREQEMWPDSLQSWRSCRKIGENDWGELFDLSTL